MTEWTHNVRVLEMDAPQSFHIEADEAARAALAKRVSVESIQSLTADLKIIPEKGFSRYHVTGTFHAKMTQICVRSAVPFPTRLTETVEGFFADKAGTVSFAQARKKREEEQGDQPNFVDEADDPEPLDGDSINLGELVAQHLSLAVDPYPVSPDAPPLPDEGFGDKIEIENPFAVLGQLRDFLDDKK